METGENSILSPLIYKWGGRSDHLSLIAKMWWFYEENLQHHIWLCTLKGGLSLKSVSEFCSWVVLPWSLPQKRLVLAWGPDLGGQGFTSSRRFCMSASHLCFESCSHLFVWLPFSIVPLFFSVSPTFSLHADKYLCFTSRKTPSSSWMSHLSELCSLSVLQLTLILSFHILP